MGYFAQRQNLAFQQADDHRWDNNPSLINRDNEHIWISKNCHLTRSGLTPIKFEFKNLHPCLQRIKNSMNSFPKCRFEIQFAIAKYFT